MRFLLLSLLTGCTGRPPDTGPEQGTDSATDTSEDTDDTGGVTPQMGTLQGTVRLPEGAQDPGTALTLGLVGVRFGDGPDIEDTFLTTPIGTSGAYSLSLDTPPPEDALIALEPTAYPGLFGAAFLPLAFVDADENGRFIPGEQIVGGSLSRLVFWLEGTIPDGFQPGWNIIDTGLSGTYETGNCLLDTTNPITWRQPYNDAYPVVYGLDEPIDIPLQGLPAAVRIEGTVAGLAEGDRLSLVPFQTLFGDPKATPLNPLTELTLSAGMFAATFDAAPDELYDVSPDPSWSYALGFGIVYQDTDESGGYTLGEQSSNASFCVNNSLAALRYTGPVADYRGWRLMECYALNAGWRVVTRMSDGTWVRLRSDAEAASLVVDPAVCTLSLNIQ